MQEYLHIVFSFLPTRQSENVMEFYQHRKIADVKMTVVKIVSMYIMFFLQYDDPQGFRVKLARECKGKELLRSHWCQACASNTYFELESSRNLKVLLEVYYRNGRKCTTRAVLNQNQNSEDEFHT